MKKAWMNISHSRFILFKLKIFGEIVTTYKNLILNQTLPQGPCMFQVFEEAIATRA